MTSCLNELFVRFPGPVPNYSCPGRVAQLVARLIKKPEVPGPIPCPATLSFLLPLIIKGSCQLLAKLCARSSG